MFIFTRYLRNYVGLGYEITSIIFIGFLHTLAFYPPERDLFYREYADGACTVESFMLAYLTIEIPFEIIASVLCTIFVNLVVGLNSSPEGFFTLCYVIFCYVNAGESIGIIFFSFVRQPGFSASFTSQLLSVFTAMCGFLSLSMPHGLEELNYVSVLKYGSLIVAVTQFSGVEFYCLEDQYLPNNTCPITSGEQLLESLNMDKSDYEAFLVMIGVLLLVYRLAAYLVLKVKMSIGW